MSITSSGRFIVLEGIDGAGKTTLLGSLADWIRGAGYQAIVTREPGGTALAEAIRTLTKQDCFRKANVVSKLLLLFAARSDHVQTVIQPALQQGAWVIADRFTEASYAYQGAGEGADPAMIAWLETHAVRAVTPDLVLLLDIPVAQAVERIMQRDRRELAQTPAVFLEKVRQGYLDRAVYRQEIYCIIDAATSAHEVFRQAQHHLRERFPDELQGA